MCKCSESGWGCFYIFKGLSFKRFLLIDEKCEGLVFWSGVSEKTKIALGGSDKKGGLIFEGVSQSKSKKLWRNLERVTVMDKNEVGDQQKEKSVSKKASRPLKNDRLGLWNVIFKNALGDILKSCAKSLKIAWTWKSPSISWKMLPWLKNAPRS